MLYGLDDYDENGIATPIRVLPQADAEALGARVMAARKPGDADIELAFRTSPHLLFPWLYDVATLASVLDSVPDPLTYLRQNLPGDLQIHAARPSLEDVFVAATDIRESP